MKLYDPRKPPDPEEWLSLDEHERIQAVESFHRRMRIRLPNAKVHAVIHVIVEAKSEKEDLTDAEKREIHKLVVALEAEG
jgi:hypothetical protein